jgi:ppGpp synthetase/RelA/SpoT-type nucleotidyltranferase
MARTKRKAAKHEVNGIVAEYRGKLPFYEQLTTTCKELVEKLLQAEGIRVHSVTSRPKSSESLEVKLSREEKHYEALGEITDLAGIRIITYFADDVDAVATMIEREFAVDTEHSIDKGKALDPDRFGYLSLHYVCTLSDTRARLPEYAAYKQCVCEIQVRSILQHAWAEIEHDLGYKAVQGIPRLMRRRFSRLAGLLEVADDEFMRLRDELAVYAAEVKRDIAEKPAQVLLDNVSLMAFIQQDDTVRRVDEELAEWVGAELREPSDEWVENDVAYLRDVGLDTIEDVRAALSERDGVIVRQWQYRVEKGKHKTLRKGICLFHLWQVLLAEEGRAKLEAAFSRFHIVSQPGDPEGVTDIVEAVERASTGTLPSRTRRGEQP